MRFLEWWATLTAWVRYPVALLVIAGSTIGLLTLRVGYGYLWGAGWALGVIPLLYGLSAADKKGYHL